MGYPVSDEYTINFEAYVMYTEVKQISNYVTSLYWLIWLMLKLLESHWIMAIAYTF